MLVHWHTYKDVLAISVCSWILAMERGALIGVYCSDVSGPPMSLELLTGFHTNALETNSNSRGVHPGPINSPLNLHNSALIRPQEELLV